MSRTREVAWRGVVELNKWLSMNQPSHLDMGVPALEL